MLLDYPGSDFPNAVYITCNTLDGYSNESGVATHVVGSSFPVVGSTVTKAGFNLSNIGYSSDATE